MEEAMLEKGKPGFGKVVRDDFSEATMKPTFRDPEGFGCARRAEKAL